MRLGTKIGIQALILLVLGALPSALFAQAPKPPSMKEQLEAQFPPGTVLSIQKEGILGVAPASSKTCAAKYQGGKLSPPDPACTSPLKNNSRPLTAGEKVYPGMIDVDLVKERISLQIVECDSCNKGGPSSGYKSQVDFQFAKGYLESAGISQIEDTISEVLAFDAGTDQQAAAPDQPGEAPADVLTNNDVVKLVQVGLADGIIISKIKASACNFDTRVDALVKLKQAGVSNAVIQAMQDAQEAAKAAPGPSGAEPGQGEPPVAAPASAPGQVSFSFRHRHRLMNANWQIVDYYCSGTLSVSADGTVAYDCAQTEVPNGQCEHLSFAPGSLKEAKIGLGGSLHLASKKKGNFDLYGNADDINRAQAAIAPLIQK